MAKYGSVDEDVLGTPETEGVVARLLCPRECAGMGVLEMFEVKYAGSSPSESDSSCYLSVSLPVIHDENGSAYVVD